MYIESLLIDGIDIQSMNIGMTCTSLSNLIMVFLIREVFPTLLCPSRAIVLIIVSNDIIEDNFDEAGQLALIQMCFREREKS